jgi:hypothetical protein
MIATITRVVLVNASTQGIEWTGLLSEFFAANPETVDEAERLLIVKILSTGGVYHFGGGAAALQWLKAVDAFLGDSKPDRDEELRLEGERESRADAHGEGA